jgi:hypothetical protein
MLDLDRFKTRLHEAIRQGERLVLWHLERDNSKVALDIAGRVAKQRELLRIVEQSGEPGGY